MTFTPRPGEIFPLVYSVAQGLVVAATTIVGAAGMASIYCELRTIKEGVSPDQLASVFS
jgi:hypothetical protein